MQLPGQIAELVEKLSAIDPVQALTGTHTHNARTQRARTLTGHDQGGGRGRRAQHAPDRQAHEGNHKQMQSNNTYTHIHARARVRLGPGQQHQDAERCGRNGRHTYIDRRARTHTVTHTHTHTHKHTGVSPEDQHRNHDGGNQERHR